MPKTRVPKPLTGRTGNFYRQQDGGLSDKLIKQQLEEQSKRDSELDVVTLEEIADGER